MVDYVGAVNRLIEPFDATHAYTLVRSKRAMTIQDFNELGLAHLPQLQAQALQLTRHPDRARDLLQESAYWAYKNWEQFQAGTNFLAWASTIIRNTFNNEYRLQRRRKALLEDKPLYPNWRSEQVAVNLVEGRIDAQKIERLVENLPAPFRDVFLLKLRGLDYHEISIRMGIPVGTVKSRVFTARRKLQAQIAQLYSIKY